VAKAPAAKQAATKRSTSKKAAPAETAAAEAPLVPAGPAENAQPAGKAAPKAAAKAAARKTARKAAPAAPMPMDGAPATASPPPSPAHSRIDAVLAVLPELAAGQSLALNVAVQRLREAQLLGRNTPSTKFFAALAERIELRPAGKPTQVLLRR
jgi:hypothetical protein